MIRNNSVADAKADAGTIRFRGKVRIEYFIFDFKIFAAKLYIIEGDLYRDPFTVFRVLKSLHFRATTLFKILPNSVPTL